LLEGKNVNLRVVEKEDLAFSVEWLNNPEVFGEYNPLIQVSRAEMEKSYGEKKFEETDFFVEGKDGRKIGSIGFFNVIHPAGNQLEIGYFIIPTERGKGYCTEAVNILVDYIFLSKNIERIQVQTDKRNLASQKVLEKSGFKMEGALRKNFFIRGKWTDDLIYSIIREEWKEPKILTKSAKEE